MSWIDRLRRRRRPATPGPQGEQYEIEKNEREAAKERNRFAESLIEKAGHERRVAATTA